MSLAMDLGKFATKASQRVDNIRRILLVKLFKAVIFDTPRLSGMLQGNWQTSTSSPLLGKLPLRPSSEADGEVDSVANGIQGNQTAYFRNNLSYAYRVEFDGWSHTKAPAGMMRKNVARIMSLVNAAIAEGKL
jgi:hypothetical protein